MFLCSFHLLLFSQPPTFVLFQYFLNSQQVCRKNWGKYLTSYLLDKSNKNAHKFSTCLSTKWTQFLFLCNWSWFVIWSVPQNVQNKLSSNNLIRSYDLISLQHLCQHKIQVFQDMQVFFILLKAPKSVLVMHV